MCLKVSGGSLSDHNTLFILFPWVVLFGGIPCCPRALFSRPAELDKQTWGPVNLSGQMWGFGATASYAGTSTNCLCAKQLPSIPWSLKTLYSPRSLSAK